MQYKWRMEGVVNFITNGTTIVVRTSKKICNRMMLKEML